MDDETMTEQVEDLDDDALEDLDDDALEDEINTILDQLLQEEDPEEIEHLNSRLEIPCKERDAREQKATKKLPLRKAKPGSGVRTAGQKVGKVLKSSAKKVLTKVNPLEKKADTHSTSDTGLESLKATYQTGKKAVHGVKTVVKSVKTTTRTIKTVDRAVQSTARTVRLNAKRTINTVKTAVRAARWAVVHAIAAASHPLFWILVAVVAILFIIGVIVALLGGVEGNVVTIMGRFAFANPVALEDEFETAYSEACEYYRIACENRQAAYNARIDNLYYNTEDLAHSNLVYLYRSQPEPPLRFENSLATDSRKQQLKDAWTVQLTVQEATAIAYVYMEKLENEAHGTEGDIYEISFTQEVFDTIINKAVRWSEVSAANQTCPGENCTVHYEESDNPAYQENNSKQDTAWHRYEDWCNVARLIDTYYNIGDSSAAESYWNYNVSGPIGEWQGKYGWLGSSYIWCIKNRWSYSSTLYGDYVSKYNTFQNTPEKIKTAVTACDHVHTLYSLSFINDTGENVMHMLGFSNAEIEWTEQMYAAIMMQTGG